jgi:ribosome modulation factor
MSQTVSRRSPIEGARKKGAEAAKAGLPVTACPYEDRRTSKGRQTWARAFRNAWLEGHRNELQGKLF